MLRGEQFEKQTNKWKYFVGRRKLLKDSDWCRLSPGFFEFLPSSLPLLLSIKFSYESFVLYTLPLWAVVEFSYLSLFQVVDRLGRAIIQRMDYRWVTLRFSKENLCCYDWKEWSSLCFVTDSEMTWSTCLVGVWSVPARCWHLPLLSHSCS